MSDQFARSVEDGIARLLPGRVVGVDDPAGEPVVFAELALLLQAAGRIILIYAAETELPVGPENTAAAEATGLIQFVLDFAMWLARAIGCGGGGLVVRRIEFINGARTVFVQGDADANRVVRRTGRRLGDDRSGEKVKRKKGDHPSWETCVHGVGTIKTDNVEGSILKVKDGERFPADHAEAW